MIIEFCGVPGAGKSFVAWELVAQLQADGAQASLLLEEVSPRVSRRQRVSCKVRRAAVEIVSHPASSTRTVSAVVTSGQQSTRDVAVRSLNWLVLRAALRRGRANDGFHVIDQGLVQELCSLGLRGEALAPIHIADPGVALLAPDLIVMVEVELGLADQRLEARPGRESRVEAEGADRRRELERQSELVEQLLSAWMSRYAWQVPTRLLRIANGRDQVDVGGQVALLRLEHCSLTQGARK